MQEIFNFQHIPLLSKTDILVIGGGSAGCTAAITAGQKSNFKVTLLERYGFLGGTSTQMLDTFYGFFTPSETPKKVVGGMPDTIVNALSATNDIFLRPNTYGAGTGVTYNPERLKLVWDREILKAGVELFLHTTLVAVEHTNEEEITCIVSNKAGFFKILAKKVIDTSGDADFCHLSDIPYELAGEKEPVQSMTTTFRMSNVNLQKFENDGGKQMLKNKMEEAVVNQTHPLPRKEGSAHEMVQQNCIATVAVKVPDLSLLKVEEATQAEVTGREQAFVYEDFFRAEVPGYESAKIIGLSHHIGVRETRRVYGEARLTKEDCLSGNIPADSVLLCGAPIEDHRKGLNGEEETYWEYIPNGGIYGIPYGTLIPKSSEKVWVAGRCFSATHDAHASCRSMGQTMSMGQTVGLAAILSLQQDTSAGEVPINSLKDQLVTLGAILEAPKKTADTSRNGWANNF